MELSKKLEEYKTQYKVQEIGKSFFGRKIFAVEKQVESGLPTAIFLCSVHAREHIATDLVCKMIDENLFDEIKNFNLSFILMANPDGVMLSYGGLGTAPTEMQEFLREANSGSLDFSLWKANGRGVDINNNFDADFGMFPLAFLPAPSGYRGKVAQSEPETMAIVDYTKKANPFLTLAFHSKGEEIYYNYFQDPARLERDRFIAERFSQSTGYKIKNLENSSSGGYKDFCVQELKIPALTIEIGRDEIPHPISKNYLDEIFERHKNVAKDIEFAYNVFERYKKDYGI